MTRTAIRNAASNGKSHSELTTLSLMEKYVLGTSKFVELPVAKIKVDSAYQRVDDLNENAVARIIRNFDTNLFEPPTVNDRDGTYYVVDGQHRCEVARRTGMSTITCRVVQVTKKEEAELFVRLNRQRIYVTPVQTFKAELAAGNPAANEISKCLESRGMSLVPPSPGMSAAAAVKTIYAQAGFVGLGRVLDVVVLAWPDEETPRRSSGQILRGLNGFFAESPTAEINRLAERLSSVTPRQLLARSSERWHGWKAIDHNESLIDATGFEIGRIYRKRS